MDAVTSDEFVDLMISKGARYAWYFNYMPVGSGAVEELIPTPEQRTHMYNWVRKMRNSKTGKPMFVIDFQDDGEYVGGCIAGGRNYFHINSAGDIEPCVFIHYSDSNSILLSRRSSVLSSRPTGTVSRSTTTICARARCSKTRSA